MGLATRTGEVGESFLVQSNTENAKIQQEEWFYLHTGKIKQDHVEEASVYVCPINTWKGS